MTNLPLLAIETPTHTILLTTIVASVSIAATAIRVFGPLVDHLLETWAAGRLAILEKHLPGTWANVLHQAAIFGAQVAEQMSLAQRISGAADVKKQYAVTAAERWLQAQGYTVDLTLLGDTIEQVILAGLHLPPNKSLNTSVPGNTLPTNNTPKA